MNWVFAPRTVLRQIAVGSALQLSLAALLAFRRGSLRLYGKVRLFGARDGDCKEKKRKEKKRAFPARA